MTRILVDHHLIKWNCKFFAGMTLGETADTLGLPSRSADRYWGFGRAWLADALADG
jgi:ECF sigma factor